MVVRSPHPKEVIIYADEHGNEPFAEWLEGLKDIVGRKRILARLARVEQGNFGDHEPVGEGVSELRMFFGPGYRIYYGEDKGNIVILLCGGDKRTQKKGIRQAQLYWKDYKEHG